MKIKGVRRDGANLGDVIELSAEEKVPLTLQDGLSNFKEFEGKCLAWFTDLALQDVSFSSKGAALKDLWQNNRYSATGRIMLHKRMLSPDRLVTPKPFRFSLEFEDCLDNMGQPDTLVTKLTLMLPE
jgi:hypothetical protein